MFTWVGKVPHVPLSRQDVHEFEQELTKHLRTSGGQVNLQAAQKLVHGLGGSRTHVSAVLARPIGTAARQEPHQDLNQSGIRHHLLCCAQVITRGWKT